MKFSIDKRELGVGVILSIIGAIMLTIVFKFQARVLLEISFISLAIGIWIIFLSIFNL